MDNKPNDFCEFSTHFFTKAADIHYIKADEFGIFVDSFKSAFSDINDKIFGGKVKFELLIIANEEGGFRAKLGVAGAILGVVGGVIGIVESDIIRGFYRGVTGGKEYNPEQIAENVGEFLRDITVGIFSKPSDEIKNIIPVEINLDKTIAAKNKFYRMCAVSPDITGLSFVDGDEIEIRKQQFIDYMMLDNEKDIPPEQFISEVTIVKSVNVDNNSKWSVKINEAASTKSVLMDDADFKKEFLAGKYALKQTSDDDKMTVLLERRKEYKNGQEKDKELAIVRVYKFNDSQILPIPNDIPRKERKADINLFNFGDVD